MENTQVITATEIYTKLYTAVRNASDTEQQLRNDASQELAVKTAIKQIDDLAAGELPACMGKLISTLELQQQFQSLGRYVRAFTDAEFVIRNLKSQIEHRLKAGALETTYAIIRQLIKCADIVTLSHDQ